jgi:hypothetical protein
MQLFVNETISGTKGFSRVKVDAKHIMRWKVVCYFPTCCFHAATMDKEKYIIPRTTSTKNREVNSNTNSSLIMSSNLKYSQLNYECAFNCMALNTYLVSSNFQT